MGLELRFRRGRPAGDVGAVARHEVVERKTAVGEPFRLGVVGAFDQAHALAHRVAVEPGRPERLLGDHPARREDDEVGIGSARSLGGAGEDGEDARVGMVEAHRPDRVEASEIVLPRSEVAVPGDDVERAVVERRRPQPAEIFLEQLDLAFHVFVGGDGGEEIARIGEAVGADRPQFGQPEEGAVILRDITSRRTVRERSAEADPAGDERDLAGRDVDPAHLGVERQAPLLWDEE